MIKKVFTVFNSFLLAIFILSGCNGKGKVSQKEIITVDVTQSYPTKKIVLQDIADVEYIPLETSDDFLWEGEVNTFTDHYIINYNQKNGDILLFDKDGKCVKKINRQGESGEEYSSYNAVTFDEEKKELFVNDRNKEKIFVYDLNGAFKRSLEYAKDKRYSDVHVYDPDKLIAYNRQFNDETPNSYLIFSKQTGEITHEFNIPQTGKKISERHYIQDENMVMVYMVATYPIMYTNPDFIITDVSNDTIFSMNASMEFTPIAVQQPSRTTMDPERFLFQAMDSKEYTFFYSVEKVKQNLDEKIKTPQLAYNKKEQKLYEQEVTNSDYSTEKPFIINPQKTQFSSKNSNVFLQVLNAAELSEAYANGQLKGRLKEIAEELDEEDNPVLLVARLK